MATSRSESLSPIPEIIPANLDFDELINFFIYLEKKYQNLLKQISTISFTYQRLTLDMFFDLYEELSKDFSFRRLIMDLELNLRKSFNKINEVKLLDSIPDEELTILKEFKEKTLASFFAANEKYVELHINLKLALAEEAKLPTQDTTYESFNSQKQSPIENARALFQDYCSKGMFFFHYRNHQVAAKKIADRLEQIDKKPVELFDKLAEATNYINIVKRTMLATNTISIENSSFLRRMNYALNKLVNINIAQLAEENVNAVTPALGK